MLSSFVSSLKEFFVAGFVSLAIVLATMRAYLIKLPTYLALGGISGFLFLSLLTVCGCIYLAVTRRDFWSGDDQRDEEIGSLGEVPTRPRPIIHALPVIMDWGRGRRPSAIYGWRRSVIRLEEDSQMTANHTPSVGHQEPQ